MKEIVTIQISKFLTNELAVKIAQKQWKASTPLFTILRAVSFVNQNDDVIPL